MDKHISAHDLRDAWHKLVLKWPALAAQVRESSDSPSGLKYRVPKTAHLQKLLTCESDLAPEKRQFYHHDMSENPLSSYWAWPRTPPVEICIVDAPKTEDIVQFTSLNAIRNFKDLLSSQKTLVSAQVTTFSDATVLTLSASHVIGDAFGVKNIFSAWADLMKGREPATQESMDRDYFAKLGNLSPTLPPNYHLFSLRQKARLIANLLRDVLFIRPEKEIVQKYVYIPEKVIQEMQCDAKEFLKSQDEKSNTNVSRSNLVFAWVIKNAIARKSHKKQHTPVTIINGRGRDIEGVDTLPNFTFSGAAAAISLPSDNVLKILQMPLASLASKLRRDIHSQITPHNLSNLYAFTVYHQSYKKVKLQPSEKSNDFPFISPPSHCWTGLTDWRAARFGQLDFSSSHNGDVKVMAIQAFLTLPMSPRDRWACLGDCGGGVWITGATGKKDWKHPSGFGRYVNISHSKKQ